MLGFISQLGRQVSEAAENLKKNKPASTLLEKITHSENGVLGKTIQAINKGAGVGEIWHAAGKDVQAGLERQNQAFENGWQRHTDMMDRVDIAEKVDQLSSAVENRILNQPALEHTSAAIRNGDPLNAVMSGVEADYQKGITAHKQAIRDLNLPDKFASVGEAVEKLQDSVTRLPQTVQGVQQHFEANPVFKNTKEALSEPGSLVKKPQTVLSAIRQDTIDAVTRHADAVETMAIPGWLEAGLNRHQKAVERLKPSQTIEQGLAHLKAHQAELTHHLQTHMAEQLRKDGRFIHTVKALQDHLTGAELEQAIQKDTKTGWSHHHEALAELIKDTVTPERMIPLYHTTQAMKRRAGWGELLKAYETDFKLGVLRHQIAVHTLMLPVDAAKLGLEHMNFFPHYNPANGPFVQAIWQEPANSVRSLLNIKFTGPDVYKPEWGIPTTNKNDTSELFKTTRSQFKQLISGDVDFGAHWPDWERMGMGVKALQGAAWPIAKPIGFKQMGPYQWLKLLAYEEMKIQKEDGLSGPFLRWLLASDK